MIYDCFPFHDELDLLEIRLEELAPVVDRFVLVEAAQTFTRQPKPLYYAENRQRFRHWWGQIDHLVVPELPADRDNWHRERHQRNFIGYGVLGCDPDDVILLTDGDEIIRRETLQQRLQHRPLERGEVVQFTLDRRFFWLNVRSTKDVASVSKMLTYQTFLDLGGPEKAARVDMNGREYVLNGGWHVSYLGGVDGVLRKLGAFCHQELNQPPFNDRGRLLRVMEQCQDPFERDNPLLLLPPGKEDLPMVVREHRARFAQHLCPWRMDP